jgi:hypothetical protein
VIVTELGAEVPPRPLQVREYVPAPKPLALPFTGRDVPVQEPEHEVAFVDVQEMVAVCPQEVRFAAGPKEVMTGGGVRGVQPDKV